MLVYIGGVLIGNKDTQSPPMIYENSYYKMFLSSVETFLMRGYRDLIIVLDGPGGVKQTIAAGILFERLPTDYQSPTENDGYNMLVEIDISTDTIITDVLLQDALKGDKGDTGLNGTGTIVSIIAGENISVNNTDINNPIISAIIPIVDGSKWEDSGLTQIIPKDLKRIPASIIDGLPLFGDIVTHDVDEFATAAQGALANTALQSFTEADPTVPSWAKTATKPSYTASEVEAEPAFSKNTGFNLALGNAAGTVLEGRTFGTAANSATTDFATRLLTSDISVVLPAGKSLGKYIGTATIPAIGLTLEEVIRDIALQYIIPTFSTQLSITGQSATIEIGTTLSGSKTFTWAIAVNSGVVSTIDIYDNTDASTLLASTPNDGTQAITITSIKLNTDGATQSWKAIAHDTGSSPSDINSNNFVITSRYIRYWGASATVITDTLITAATANRTFAETLTSNAFKTSGANTFTLVTGTTQTKMVVLLPPSIIITSVVDTTNLNANLTSNYILTQVYINDAGGTARLYNMYVMTLGAPYPISANHVITTN
jgi:hypothetical protein